MQENKDMNPESLPESNQTDSSQKNSSEVKVTVIKCISIILCVVLVTVTLSQCITKYSDNNLSIAKLLSSSGSGAAVPASDSYDTDVPSDVPSDDTAPTDDTALADDAAAGDSTGATDSQSTAQPSQQSGSSSSSSGASASNASKVPSTKQEILNYFNTAINDVKPHAKSITKVMDKDYQSASVELGSLGALKGIVNSLISANMGENTDKIGVTAKTVAEKNKMFPVENESWASKLTVNDIKSATLTEKNGVYTITIKVVDDPLSETTNHGESHHGRAFSIVQTQSIYDNAGAAKSLITGLKIGYSNGVIVATVDAKTGHVTHAKYDYTWKLHVSAAGGVTAPFGIYQEFDIKW
ncbi:MAG: hypothetical protein ACI4XH_05290 [Acutalibacteraceae bacterium]